MLVVLLAALSACALFNQAPIASFTAIPASGPAPLLVQYDASTTIDPDNDALTYGWNFGDSTTGSAISGFHTYTTPGTYEIQLVVTDSNGNTSMLSRSILVTAPDNDAPVASFTAAPTSGAAPLAVVFNASASNDPDGTIDSYHWNFGDSTSATGKNATHGYATEGAYVVTLTVEDNEGATATESVIILVNAPGNQLPVADFTVDPEASFLVSTVFDFDASASHDPDGSIVAYQWDFGDGDVGAGQTTTHQYAGYGTYNVILTVYDNVGAPASHIQEVNLHPLVLVPLM
ncbi:PKD domain-containing protein [Candidatus Bipolaricaulota bacterium]